MVPSTKSHSLPTTKHQAPSTKHQVPSIKHQVSSTICTPCYCCPLPLHIKILVLFNVIFRCTIYMSSTNPHFHLCPAQFHFFLSLLSLSLPLPPCQWWANILYPVALPQCWDLKNIHISVKTANRYAAHLATRALGHI